MHGKAVDLGEIGHARRQFFGGAEVEPYSTSIGVSWPAAAVGWRGAFGAELRCRDRPAIGCRARDRRAERTLILKPSGFIVEAFPSDASGSADGRSA